MVPTHDGSVRRRTSSARLPRVVRVLYVDDDPLMLRTLRRMSVDLDVTTAEGRAAALDALAIRRYDVVVAELRVRGISGRDLAQAIRRHDAAVSLVFLTAVLRVTDLVHPRAFRYLEKPVPTRVLRSVVEAAAAASTAARRRAVR